MASNLRNYPITELAVSSMIMTHPNSDSAAAAIALAVTATWRRSFCPKGQRGGKFQRASAQKCLAPEMAKQYLPGFPMEHQRLQPRRTQPRQKFSSQWECRALAAIHRTADARSHELRYVDRRCMRKGFVALIIKIFQALFQFARPTGFPLSPNSRQRPPNIRFISLWQ